MAASGRFARGSVLSALILINLSSHTVSTARWYCPHGTAAWVIASKTDQLPVGGISDFQRSLWVNASGETQSLLQMVLTILRRAGRRRSLPVKSLSGVATVTTKGGGRVGRHASGC